MPVDSDPCSCQPDCLVCVRGEIPPNDCAIHVLLEWMVFQERMLHGEPTEASLEEILQSGKEYLPRAMHLTDQNSTQYKTSTAILSNHVVQNSFAQSSSGCYGKIYFRLVALLGHVFTKSFDTLVIQGQRCVAGPHDAKARDSLDVVILNAGHDFCHQSGRDLRATNYLPSCTFSRLGVQNFIEKSVAPVPLMDILVSSTPPCDKSIQTPSLPFQPSRKTPTIFCWTLSLYWVDSP
ncbi:uncharacterized protein TNCV_3409511 [Trichonephila clavipes]|nr:uncharacterized protein TNCV_3409511 [Trichonephila clavipes]